jgi:hypothetical protein
MKKATNPAEQILDLRIEFGPDWLAPVRVEAKMKDGPREKCK